MSTKEDGWTEDYARIRAYMSERPGLSFRDARQEYELIREYMAERPHLSFQDAVQELSKQGVRKRLLRGIALISACLLGVFLWAKIAVSVASNRSESTGVVLAALILTGLLFSVGLMFWLPRYADDGGVGELTAPGPEGGET